MFGFVSLMIASVMFLFPNKIAQVESVKTSDQSISLDEKKNLKQEIPIEALNEENPEKVILKQQENEESNEILKEKIYMDSGTLVNTLNLTGSMISMNHIGIYKSEKENKSDTKSIEINSNVDSKKLIQKAASLFKNPVYVFLVIVAALEGLLQNSFLAFAALFIEYQYRLASGTASFVLGVLSIPPLILGGLVSGLIVKRFKNNTLSCFKFLTVVLFFNLMVYAGFLIYCQEPNLVMNNPSDSIEDNCFKTAGNCNCDKKIFRPVCLNGSSGIFFQSPCLAGCANFIEPGSGMRSFYNNCTQSACNKYFDEKNLIDLDKRVFIDGLCPSRDCTPRLAISFICIFLLMFFNALIFLPYLKVIIGCVDCKEMNTIVLGLKQFFMNACGTIPGPILFGAVIDTTCKYWHIDSKNQKVCKMYNNRRFALGFGLLGIGFKSICFILIVISLMITIRKAKQSTRS